MSREEIIELLVDQLNGTPCIEEAPEVGLVSQPTEVIHDMLERGQVLPMSRRIVRMIIGELRRKPELM